MMGGLRTVRTLPNAAMASAPPHTLVMIQWHRVTPGLHALGGMAMRCPCALALRAHWAGWLVLMEGRWSGIEEGPLLLVFCYESKTSLKNEVHAQAHEHWSREGLIRQRPSPGQKLWLTVTGEESHFSVV